MNVKIHSISYLGVDPFLVEVEVDISNGLPIFSIVGLGDTAILESKYRIRASLKNSGYPLDPKRIVINLSPAGIRKEGTQFDLPIALGVMIASGKLDYKKEKIDNYLFLGELSLDGKIKSIKGVINALIFAKENNYKGVVIPYDNINEASLIKGVDIIPIKEIGDVVNFINEDTVTEFTSDLEYGNETFDIDFSDVKGQENAKRALEISAAGGHNIILIGSPGSGKSMLSKRIVTILPQMSEEEIIESTKIHSIAGELNSNNPIISKRPCRSPHHSSSLVSIIGGGKKVMPGEISLASEGVLILDEISEFNRSVLESLRQPLEDKVVSITRALYRVEFKSNFLLVATSNPCNCGFAFESNCKCSEYEVNKYMKRLSGPILDRIDLYIEMRRLSDEELVNSKKGENSSNIKERVILARNNQEQRYKEQSENHKKNSDMTQDDLRKYCNICDADKSFLLNAISRLNISARGYDKILKVARTIADLANETDIKREHILEAIAFRKR